MKKSFTSFIAALALTGLASFTQAAPVTVDFTTDFAGRTPGEQVASIPGMSFSLTDANDVVVGAPIYDGYSGLYNQLTASGPAFEHMIFTFASAATNIRFDFAGGGPRGQGHTRYRAWDANGTQIAAGGLIALDSMTLPDGVARIQFDSLDWINYATGEPMPPIALHIAALHAELNVPAVPEPEMFGMLLGGLAILATVRRRRPAA
ncbi:conserved hypothetical protein [Ricinus communis]|uniref:PEP-CTERM protein-sorting domain-containing protein n=1 Tax=Ricinus communis TaxID=3988 RepID=B9TCB5_RICCO|nr:conserved hypothetical protein [Ricinus communis]